MLLGPIFQIEMVAIARRRRYTLLRVVYGALMMMPLLSAYAESQFAGGDWKEEISIQAGQKLTSQFFISFSWLQMIALLAVGPAMAVGTIASERERRTIEYLFTTDLANYEIVLGKITARLCLLWQLVLVGLPVLFMFRLLGGISTDLLLGSFLLAGSTSVMLTTFSVCLSVWSPRTRDATTRVYLLLIAWLVLPLILRMIGMAGLSNTLFWDMVDFLLLGFLDLLNPVVVLGEAFLYGVDRALLLKSILLQLMCSGFATLLAIAAVRRVHLRDSTRGEKVKKVRRLLSRRTRPLGESPIIWKEVFSASATTKLGIVGNIALGLLMSTILILFFTMFYQAVQNLDHQNLKRGLAFALTQISIMLGVGILIFLATVAASSISTEKERDCWNALLATPLTGREIIWGKACGCFYAMRWPLALLAVAWLMSLIVVPEVLLAAMAMIVTVLATTWFTVNLGLYFSLRSLTTMRAMGATVATLFFCGGGYLFCCCAVMMTNTRGDDFAILLAPCIPFLLGFPATELINEPMEMTVYTVSYKISYILGTVGYMIAGLIIYYDQVTHFDELTGRCSTKPDDLKPAGIKKVV